MQWSSAGARVGKHEICQLALLAWQADMFTVNISGLHPCMPGLAVHWTMHICPSMYLHMHAR